MATYTVKPGDTMWRIAIKHGISLDELIAANPQITNPVLLFQGKLSIFRILAPKHIPLDQVIRCGI